MSTYYEGATLYVKHLPDTGPDASHPRPDTVELGAGMLQVGVVVNGVEIALADIKASDTVQRIEKAQASSQQQSSQQAQADQQSTAGQPGSGYEQQPSG